MAAININSVSAASFPYNATYKYGLSSVADNQEAANATLLQEWEGWKSRHITSSGAGGFKRVQRDSSTSYDTVSEGLGYGMLLAVYFKEQALYDDLYRYVKLHFNGNGLMAWHLDASGNLAGTGANGCATDADEDIAVSLVFAHKQWGSSGSINYSQEANNLINNLANHCLDGDILKPGDSWGGWSTVNASYFAPAWYKIFAKFTGNTKWNSVADKCYQIIESVKNKNSGTGLVPDWCTGDGSAVSGMGYNYYYDATRYPWRTVLDYLWFGDERAKTNCDLINKFFKNIGPANIKSGYSITGSQVGSDHNSPFVAPIAASSLTGYDLSFAKAMHEENIKVKDPDAYCYYGGCLRMITMLYTTGNFPNLYEDVVVKTPTPTIATPTPTIATPTPTQSGSVLLGDVNGDGSANSIDFGYMKMKLLGQISSFPSPNGDVAADMNKDGAFNSLDFGYMKMLLLGMIK
ncbi:glycosyl hydrolase family 8 [Acetivibrio cellulolyticus]|uniref:glycosyl hydrolase family 8 n=1 Tax=Acetivibrio cellulolyticus TaxID=35830 RepID=UPI000A04F25B|nr:glycosyl hydrolase family 8 [Acetivibrio cellulolyticus]